jgi:hypothetical protein
MSSEQSVLAALGIDPDELEWQDFAVCRGMEPELWCDIYESDEQSARAVDQACFSCPVMKQCLSRGIENSEWGVWGGVYLTAGKPDQNRNSHKSQEDWEIIREAISEGT